mgnify:CR=1 FL=1
MPVYRTEDAHLSSSNGSQQQQQHLLWPYLSSVSSASGYQHSTPLSTSILASFLLTLFTTHSLFWIRFGSEPELFVCCFTPTKCPKPQLRYYGCSHPPTHSSLNCWPQHYHPITQSVSPFPNHPCYRALESFIKLLCHCDYEFFIFWRCRVTLFFIAHTLPLTVWYFLH